MRREIYDIKSAKQMDACCPGHDDWPRGSYSNNRSKRARARDIKKEHRYVRRVKNQILKKEASIQ